MTSDLDTVFNRHHTGSKKWSQYPADVLPLWLADMDFAVAPAIIEALTQRLQHPLLGYSQAQDNLRSTLVAYLANTYQWHVEPDALVFLPGVEPGFNMALKGLVVSGAPVVLQTPNYSPLRNAPGHWNLPAVEVPFEADDRGEYVTNIAALAQALDGAGALLLSNPHNPLGKAFSVDELQQIAAACLARDVLIIADEIHADLLFDGRLHTPIASLSAEISQRSVTLMSASKAYNIAGMKTAFAIIENPQLRQRFMASRLGMVDSVNALGLEATRAAYAEGGEWLEQVRAYLQGNRDYLAHALQHRLPGIRMNPVQGTFLAWMDCSALGLKDPQRFFLEHARVALSAGIEFGAAYGQYVRLNFGCPRPLLEEGIACIQRSLERG